MMFVGRLLLPTSLCQGPGGAVRKALCTGVSSTKGSKFAQTLQTAVTVRTKKQR